MKHSEELAKELVTWVRTMPPSPGKAVTRRQALEKVEELVKAVQEETLQEPDVASKEEDLTDRLIKLLENIGDDYLDAHFDPGTTLHDIAKMVISGNVPPVYNVRIRRSVTPGLWELDIEGEGVTQTTDLADVEVTVRDYLELLERPGATYAHINAMFVLHPYAEQFLKEVLSAAPEQLEAELTARVMGIFALAESHDTLLWRIVDGRMLLWANVSDVFAWGGADAEEITYSRLHILAEAFRDLKAREATGWIAELYAARIRKARPTNRIMATMKPEVMTLFEDCGPVPPTTEELDARLDAGIAQANAGKTHDLGDFQQHAEEG